MRIVLTVALLSLAILNVSAQLEECDDHHIQEGEYEMFSWLPKSNFSSLPDFNYKLFLQNAGCNVWRGIFYDNRVEVFISAVYQPAYKSLGGAWKKGFDSVYDMGALSLFCDNSIITGQWTYRNNVGEWGYWDLRYIGPAKLPEEGAFVEAEASRSPTDLAEVELENELFGDF